MGRFAGQRRMAERLKDPIMVKTQNRKQKTNLNAFKSKFLTLKKKVSALQVEVGTEPDFLLLVKNNLQDPTVAKPSKMAGKYMCYGIGEISDLFFNSGTCSPIQRPKGAQTPSNCHISPKCWQNISNTNIFILLTHVSQPSARRAHRHLSTVIYPPIVGRIYPIQIYLLN